MKFQVVSDLHCNHSVENNREILSLNPTADILLDAGDSFHVSPFMRNPIVSSLFEDKWSRIISIPGNHDFYCDGINSYFSGNKGKWFGDLHFQYLNNSCVVIEDVVIIGTTLWSYISPLNESECRNFTDFRYIRGITAPIYNEWYSKSVAFIAASLRKHKNKKAIVMTHHCPLERFVSPGFETSSINFFFLSNVPRIIGEYANIKVWIHGHLHTNVDEEVGGVRFIRNPLGYCSRHENPSFKKDLVIEV